MNRRWMTSGRRRAYRLVIVAIHRARQGERRHVLFRVREREWILKRGTRRVLWPEKFSLRCCCSTSHPKRKKKRYIQSWLHKPETEKGRWKKGAKRIERNSCMDLAYRSPTVSLFELRPGYSARPPKGKESTREEEPRSLRSHDQMVWRNSGGVRSQGFVAGSRPSSLALWRIVRKPMTWRKRIGQSLLVSRYSPVLMRRIGG